MTTPLPKHLADVLAVADLPRATIAARCGISPDAVRTALSTLRRRGLWQAGAGEARVTIDVHPLALLFPAMEGEAEATLRADVAAHGLREPILLTPERAILDGRNRFAALLAAGLIDNPVRVSALGRYFRTVTLPEADWLGLVLSRNLARRHLSESQRALVAAKLATMGHGGVRRGTDQAASLPVERPPHGSPVTQERAGEMLNVSERSVRSARALVEHAAPELVKAVEAGDVSIHAAEAVAARPVAEQAEIVARGRAEILHAAKAFRAEATAEKKARRAERESALAGRIVAANAALDEAGAAGRRYGVILADPEWRFEPWSRETGMDRAPENHYPTSPLETIKARPVARLAAEDCALFLWATAPMLPEALEVMAAWGFAYKTQLVWIKDALGTGYWFRSAHELLLVGTRGNVPAPAMGTQWASVLEAPRGAHSAKPPRVHALIEDYFPTLPKIELNARAARPGWDAWGAEAPGEA